MMVPMVLAATTLPVDARSRGGPASIISTFVAVWHHLDPTTPSHSRRRGSKPNVSFAFWFEAPRSLVP
jgi:hypothetical protein